MSKLILRLSLLILLCYVPGVFAQSVGNYESHQFDGSVLEINTSGADLRLAFVRNNIVRIDFIPDESAQFDSSLAVLPESASPITSTLSLSDSTLTLSGGTLSVLVAKLPVRLSFVSDGETKTYEPDYNAYSYWDPASQVTWTAESMESFYGTGEHNISFDLRGQTVYNWNVPNFGYSDPQAIMNISAPVLYSSRGWGVFIDNPHFGTWDIDPYGSNVIRYTSDAGPMRYYFFAGDDVPDLLEAYTWLTGRQPMPPLWSLGFLQSKFGYFNESQTMDVANDLRDNRIPADAIILDLYWFDQMGDLTWNLERFPDPVRIVKDLLDMGLRTILINEPYFTQSSDYYHELLSQPELVGHTESGDPYTLPEFWYCDCDALLLDMSNPAARDWYREKAVTLLADSIGGLWTDLGEPERHPEDMMHAGGTADDVHNSYNLLWSQTVAEAFAEQRPGRRIFNLTRSGSAGSQRYGVFTWSGDVQASWLGFIGQPSFVLQMGLSGFAYHSSDLGGFTNNYNPNLYTRWLAHGALSPVMRAHGDHKITEPYGFDDEHTIWNRQIIELRYKLLPYLYTLVHENSQTGMPIVRPLFFADPDDPRFRNEDTAYLFGDRLLVAPVMVDGAEGRDVPFPQGNWIDYWTDDIHLGSQDEYVPSPLGTIPLLARAGCLLPLAPVMQYTEERPLDTLFVHSYPTESGSDEFTLYEDDGISYDYQTGAFSELPMQAEWSAGSHVLRIGPRSGGYDGMVPERTFLVEVHRTS
ncbi:MAG: TIM-barrel domain-containing protein, partial [bacterium]